MPWYEIAAIVAVLLFIVGSPIAFNLFGKEDTCGRSWWDRFKASKK